jgi:hypothetical protein
LFSTATKIALEWWADNQGAAMPMKYRFVAFHTMMRGLGKPAYVVRCAKALAERGAKVLVLDALMYEQGAIAHQFYVELGSTPPVGEGRNLYDLFCDYETLHPNTPSAGQDDYPAGLLKFPEISDIEGHKFPNVCGRMVQVPDWPSISFLPGNDGKIVEVRKRIDFHALYEDLEGHRFFDHFKKTLSENFDVVLINAPAGHQEISGILCGQVADLILAIDLDSPVVDPDASFESCKQLARRIQEEGGRKIEVTSIKGHDQEEVIEMILQD